MIRSILLPLLCVILTISNAFAGDSKAYSVIRSYLSPRVIGSGYLRGPGETALYLFTCGGPESAIGGDVFKGSDVNDFIHLAYYVLDTSKTLDLAGYPRSVWKTTLDQYEIEQVRIITCAGVRRLAGISIRTHNS
jgi:hypothetical protein